MGKGEGFENASAIGVVLVTVAALCAASFQVFFCLILILIIKICNSFCFFFEDRRFFSNNSFNFRNF